MRVMKTGRPFPAATMLVQWPSRGLVFSLNYDPWSVSAEGRAWRESRKPSLLERLASVILPLREDEPLVDVLDQEAKIREARSAPTATIVRPVFRVVERPDPPSAA